MKLNGNAAIVTGAGKGIGKTIALELAKEGVMVVVNYNKSEEAALEVVNDIVKSDGKAIAIKANMENEQEINALFSKTKEQYGKIDILINNAGLTIDKPLIRLSAKEFDTMMNVNLRGAFLCLKQAGRHMLRNRYGRIVSISSVVGLTGNAGQAGYAASKAGLIGLTKSFAREFARTDITANIVAPGAIDTAMIQNLEDDIKEQILTKIPKNRLGTCEEVAKMVSFLCSKDAGYITGQVFSINGGMLM